MIAGLNRIADTSCQEYLARQDASVASSFT